jgi:hypothetical protein
MVSVRRRTYMIDEMVNDLISLWNDPIQHDELTHKVISNFDCMYRLIIEKTVIKMCYIFNNTPEEESEIRNFTILYLKLNWENKMTSAHKSYLEIHPITPYLPNLTYLLE